MPVRNAKVRLIRTGKPIGKPMKRKRSYGNAQVQDVKMLKVVCTRRGHQAAKASDEPIQDRFDCQLQDKIGKLSRRQA